MNNIEQQITEVTKDIELQWFNQKKLIDDLTYENERRKRKMDIYKIVMDGIDEFYHSEKYSDGTPTDKGEWMETNWKALSNQLVESLIEMVEDGYGGDK